jgi:sn-glycerol 3-phosphate transport system ATP-binding protein/multiple sugar transport system ATP-binding protein
MATVYFDEATRRFSKDDVPAVDGITLDIADGEFLVLVGPSGCGKSTTLRMLAGLEPVDGGRILVDGHDQKGVRPRDRDIAMVFQSYALYPNMSAAQNMAFALDNAKVSKAETKQRVDEAAKILELEQLLDRKPGQMSGGQRQRVAMGRAIVRNPKVFCMDEPLSNLDAKLRVSTRSQIAGLQRRLGITTVYVTHDQVEAMTMGHRVAVLRDGRLQQVDTPERLYDHPVNTFVAAFIGSPAITLVESSVREGAASVHGVRVPLDRALSARAGEKVVVGLRPESWRVVETPAPDRRNGSDSDPGSRSESGSGSSSTALPLTVELVESLGAESFVYGRPAGADESVGRVTVRLDKRTHLRVGDTVHVAPNEAEVHLFDATSGERIEA